MKRIFTTLAVFSLLLLIAAYVLGLTISDATISGGTAAVETQGPHVLIALFALLFAAFVHSVWLTYFMGTGRWLEETCRAYALSEDFQAENRSMKYGTIPAILGAFLLLLVTGAVGAAVDTNQLDSWAGFTGPMIHFLLASLTLGANIIVNFLEYQTISRNSQLIKQVMDEVRRMRLERGLPV